MRNNVKIVFLVVILALITLFTVSCGEEVNYTSIETPNLEYKDGAYRVSVSSDVSLFDLSSLFVVSEKANFFISSQENFENSVGFEIELTEGENTYYLKVSDGTYESVYKFIIYRKKQCTVTFNTNGGSEVPEIKCEEEQILDAPQSLKLGYTLNWDYDFNTPINSDVTINANWTANKYKINVENSDLSFEVVYGETPILTVPDKLGYKFVEWQYNGTKFDTAKNYTIANDIVIKPIYEVQKFTINYVTIGGVNTNPLTYTVEDEIVLSNLNWEMSSEDTVMHVFDGWYKDIELTQKIVKIEKGTTGSIDLYAKWTITDIPQEKIETAITFNATDFECNGTIQKVIVGEEYSLPRLEKNGYIFNGWKTEDGVIVVQPSGVWAIKKENITLVPIWTERSYSISYVLNGGVNNSQNVETYYITDSIVLLDPEKQYSTFNGWYLDENFENKITEITEGSYGDFVVYAKWENITVKVNFDANGGQVSQESQELILGTNYSLIEPQKLGYKFDGWYNGEVLVSLNGTWTNEETLDLVAKWSVETYSISYELNGGTVEGTVDSYTVETDSFVLPIPVSGDRKFIGWSVNDGPITMNMIVLKGSVGNRTYVAHWFDLEKDGVVYSVSDGVATVTGYKGTIGATIVIPSEFNGYKVVAIGNNAFSGYGDKLANVNTGSGFATLYIPDTITRIGANAFKECDDLKVQISDADDKILETWVDTVVVESGNSHVVDVIMGKRPAIGWKVYYKPEN